MLEQLTRLYQSLTARQLIGIVATVIAVAGAIYGLVTFSRERDFRPLYRELAPEDASQVVTKLKENNVEYRLAENGTTVLVRSGRVADTRLIVAGAGLPKTGRIGFEIFDKTNFGASDFAEQINFRRALEGELERSVMALSEVEHARVHLTLSKESIFAESRQPAKASVLVKLRHGAKMAPANVLAIGHLVASAVEGLAPEAVTVVDMQGNLLSRRSRPLDGMDSDAPIEYRQRVEKDLLAKIYATLEPVLGTDHFRAGVSAEVDFTSGEQSEETWDPNKSVMVNQQRTEESAGATPASGVPGTASSLPRPTSRPGAGAGNGVVRRTENITYQSSRLVRRTKLPQGAVRRLSVSAILDHNIRWEGTGPKAKRIVEAPGEEMMKKVRDLIAAAVGFNQERGDQIVVQALPFEATLRAEPPRDPSGAPPPPPAILPFGLDRWLAEKNIKVSPVVILAAAIGVIVLLLLAPIVWFLRRSKKKAASAGAERIAGAGSLPEIPAGSGPAQSVEEALEAKLAQREVEREKAEREMLSTLQLPEVTTKKSEVLSKHISEQAKRDPSAVAQLLRTWMYEKDR